MCNQVRAQCVRGWQHSGDSSHLQSELDETTQKQVDALKSSFAQNKDKVVEDLLKKVVETNPEVISLTELYPMTALMLSC